MKVRFLTSLKAKGCLYETPLKESRLADAV